MVFTCHCEYRTKLSKATGGEFVHEQLGIYPLLDLPAWTVSMKSESDPCCLFEFFCCRNLAVLRKHSVCEAIQTQAGTQDNTLAEDEILSAITDSNGPYPETAKTYQYI